ncbi:MAG: NAD(P)H-dependent oxidoreductase subunit E [Actinomycetota bacterium]|nr:NAD(P)H-dependent oxidoreductase subunit E [Actinomycetota bacterium]
MTVFTPDLRARAEELVARYPTSRSALLPLLYLVQSRDGYVTREGMRECGEILGLTTAEVEAVATFYTMFKKSPSGRWLLSVCTNVSCVVVGAREVFDRAREVLGPGSLDITEDGTFTLEEVECLGACDAAPVVQVNYCNYARVSSDGVAELIERLRQEDPPDPMAGPPPAPHDDTSRILAGLGDDRG